MLHEFHCLFVMGTVFAPLFSNERGLTVDKTLAGAWKYVHACMVFLAYCVVFYLDFVWW